MNSRELCCDLLSGNSSYLYSKIDIHLILCIRMKITQLVLSNAAASKLSCDINEELLSLLTLAIKSLINVPTKE